MSNIITERDYWRDPVSVFTGCSWLVIGGVAGFIIGYIST